jgi:hypothetical protein
MGGMDQRGNGLTAQSWLPLADVETALTDHVLQALADAQIAAYAESTSTGHEPFLGSSMSAMPSDRISVDGARRKEARSLLDDLLPELRNELERARQADEAQAWQSIVATLERPDDPEAIRWPSEAEVRDDARRAASPTTPTDDGADEWADARPEAPEVPEELLGGDDDDEFVPPVAPPIPTADAVTRLAWIGLIGGPLYMFLSVFLGWDIDDLGGLLAVGAFVGGFVTLVARMKDRPPLDESDDDGARI